MLCSIRVAGQWWSDGKMVIIEMLLGIREGLVLVFFVKWGMYVGFIALTIGLMCCRFEICFRKMGYYELMKIS